MITRVVVVLTLVLAGFVLGAEVKPPNVVFIFADDWGWGEMPRHGNKDLDIPNLEKFFSQGTEFTQFYVMCPVCSPSRAALMTGQNPARFNIHYAIGAPSINRQRDMADWLDPEAVTLPRLFKSAGYVTGHFGKWHLTTRVVKDQAPSAQAYGIDEAVTWGSLLGSKRITEGMEYDAAIDFITRHKDQPFYLNLWIHEPHVPHWPTQESLEYFAGLDERKRVIAAVLRDGDRKIGRVLQTLDELGLTDHTIVVFSSDNGPEWPTDDPNDKGDAENGFGRYYSVGSTAGMLGQKRSLFEGGVRVPFAVRWPGHVPAGKINDTTVLTAADMLPTLCAAAKISLPEKYISDGVNMLPAFLGKMEVRQTPIYWQFHEADDTGPYGEHLAWPYLAIREGNWKLIVNKDRSQIRLYDLSNTRIENTDVSKDQPKLVKELLASLDAWVKTLPEHPNPKLIGDPNKAAKPDGSRYE